LCFQDSVELDEIRQPIFVQSRRLIPDSEGAGRFRGALGCEAIFGPTEAPICIAYVSDGNHHPPQGTRGGLAGGASAQYVLHADGRREPLPNAGEVWLEPGQMIVSVSTGGGGYGDPATREPLRVLHDVREGWVSPVRAEQVYRVAIRGDAVDPVATAALRGG
jgi:N-methylhydantoinase B